MISLIQAVKIMDLRDDDSVELCHEHLDPHSQRMSIKDIRATYDMRRVKVKRIYPYHYFFDPTDDTIEFIITSEFKKTKQQKQFDKDMENERRLRELNRQKRMAAMLKKKGESTDES